MQCKVNLIHTQRELGLIKLATTIRKRKYKFVTFNSFLNFKYSR